VRSTSKRIAPSVIGGGFKAVGKAVLLDFPQVAYKTNDNREIDPDRCRTGIPNAHRPVAAVTLVRVDVSWILSQAVAAQQLGAC
jgi:hypothetical protein